MSRNRERDSEAVAITLPQQRQTVLWIIAILLAIIATVLVVRSQESLLLQRAYGDQPMAGARGIFAFTGQLDEHRYGLFMMDVDNGSIWCYEYLPSTRKLHLVAARSFRYDRYLESFNNAEDTAPEVIKRLVEEERNKQDRNSRGGAAEDDDEVLGTNVPGFPYPQEEGRAEGPKTAN